MNGTLKTQKRGYVYILQSQLNLRFYVGSTSNMERRMLQHRDGYVKATKNLRPLELKFHKEYASLKEARQMEYKLKRMKSRLILERVIQDQDLKLELEI